MIVVMLVTLAGISVGASVGAAVGTSVGGMAVEAGGFVGAGGGAAGVAAGAQAANPNALNHKTMTIVLTFKCADIFSPPRVIDRGHRLATTSELKDSASPWKPIQFGMLTITNAALGDLDVCGMREPGDVNHSLILPQIADPVLDPIERKCKPARSVTKSIGLAAGSPAFSRDG